MNKDKLSRLQENVRIGGKGTPRRKKKLVHKTVNTDQKKLQNTLKKLVVNNIPGIEEVNMIRDDGVVIHFNNPKVEASLSANTFAINGHGEMKQITEMLPSILSQLGTDSFQYLRKLSEVQPMGGDALKTTEAAADDDEEVPQLVENFDEASKEEGV